MKPEFRLLPRHGTDPVPIPQSDGIGGFVSALFTVTPLSIFAQVLFLSMLFTSVMTGSALDLRITV